MAKDEKFIERNDAGQQIARQHNRVAAKIHGMIESLRRITEDAGFDRAAYGDNDDRPRRAPGHEFCTRCGKLYPANAEHFRTDNTKECKWKQPCRKCDAELTALRRMHKAVTGRHFKRSFSKRKA